MERLRHLPHRDAVTQTTATHWSLRRIASGVGSPNTHLHNVAPVSNVGAIPRNHSHCNVMNEPFRPTLRLTDDETSAACPGIRIVAVAALLRHSAVESARHQLRRHSG